MRETAERRLRDRRRAKPSLRKGRLLHVRSGLSAEKTLLLRIGIVIVLIALVIAVFWFDRDGLRDNLDDHVSFPDILYFAMITVTTVGYGDIHPVSGPVRLICGVEIIMGVLLLLFGFSDIIGHARPSGRQDRNDPL